MSAEALCKLLPHTVPFYIVDFEGDIMSKKAFDRKVISSDDRKKRIEKANRDNRANQLNPQHPAYWRSRGYTFDEDEYEDEDDDRLHGPA